MVIDTSALVAILLREPEGEYFTQLLASASQRLISAVTRVELSFVVEGRYGEAGRRDMERLLLETGTEIAVVTAEQAEIAIAAFRQFGKGHHPAALNIGDCFAYALAKMTGLPLLFKGSDFARTDISAAAAHN